MSFVLHVFVFLTTSGLTFDRRFAQRAAFLSLLSLLSLFPRKARTTSLPTMSLPTISAFLRGHQFSPPVVPCALNTPRHPRVRTSHQLCTVPSTASTSVSIALSTLLRTSLMLSTSSLDEQRLFPRGTVMPTTRHCRLGETVQLGGGTLTHGRTPRSFSPTHKVLYTTTKRPDHLFHSTRTRRPFQTTRTRWPCRKARTQPTPSGPTLCNCFPTTLQPWIVRGPT